jgi:hypothetical protein
MIIIQNASNTDTQLRNKLTKEQLTDDRTNL